MESRRARISKARSAMPELERCPKCGSFAVFHCVRGKGQRITEYGPRCENPHCGWGKDPLYYFRRKRDAIAFWNALAKGKERPDA